MLRDLTKCFINVRETYFVDKCHDKWNLQIRFDVGQISGVAGVV